MIWDSFFDDDETQQYAIWKKVQQKDEDRDLESLIHEGILMKHDKKEDVFKECWFVLTRQRLYYKKVGRLDVLEEEQQRSKEIP
jgi:hypothetical protein